MGSPQPLVVHITSSDVADWEMALRNLVNLVNDDSVATPPELMQVVVNGHAVRFLLDSAPEASKLTRMANASVDIDACANSLERVGHAATDLAEGVTAVRSGVAEVTRAQGAGATYLKLP